MLCDLADLTAIEAESIGWQPLGDDAYLHIGNPDEEDVVITVTGVPEAGMVGMHVLWAYSGNTFIFC